MAARVVAKDVTKRYGELVALDDVNLSIEPGEIFGLIGPNGAGKTTFLRVVTGYHLPSAGDVEVDGFSVVRERFEVQRRLGYVCEQPRLYADHAVDTFLRFIGELRGLGGHKLKAAIEDSIERFGLGSVCRRRIGVLSKGFRQRVSLAQAMLHDPPLLVIDEPTVGLDPIQQIELRRILQSLRGDHTLILSTHQLREAEACCDRVGLIDAGKLQQITGAEDLAAAGRLEKLFLERMSPPEAQP